MTSIHVAPVVPLNVPLDKHVPDRVLDRVFKVLKQVVTFAGRLPGQNSVSKLDAFERFRQETSLPWVFLIVFVTPLPWLIINLLVECIPLNDPAAGFWGSGYYQLRMFCTSIFSSIAPAVVKLDCVPGFPVRSVKALVIYGLFQGIVCLGTNMIISLAANIFPVPFSQFTVILPMWIGGRLVFFRKLPDDPQFYAISDKVNQWLGMETLPILVYPVFTAIFTVLTPSQQLWVSLLLPVLKLAVRGALWSVSKNDADVVGVITCCVGHLYHVLFTAMILQNSKSLKTLAVVAFFSTGQMLFNCRYILTDSNNINEARGRMNRKKEEHTTDDNLCTALRYAEEMRIAQNLHWRTPSLLLSTYQGYREVAFMKKHHEMLRAATLYNAAFVYNNPKKAGARGPRSNIGKIKVVTGKSTPANSMSLGLTRILPDSDKPRQSSDRIIRLKSDSSFVRAPRSHSDPSAWANAGKEEGRLARQEAFIHEVASALYQTEMILLRSYITICMTLFYVIYLQAVFRLKNRQYFATLVYMTTIESVDKTVLRLILLCAMETVFLSIYLVMIQRRLGISGMYQLAFVLRSQRVLVQAKFYVTNIILGFPLTHNGNDSILRFDSFD
ncbi:hypothetical protein PHMEG_0007173 [Phytophthora megakarya]|uniref:Transmembrane protein n=1 Tax=Phytophthora megakarya TaxID=4795 RepID=A0A225WMH0_9STRA|nr:hypothetical protein PHMEG_0007173 [Phytophthora megakarya]